MSEKFESFVSQQKTTLLVLFASLNFSQFIFLYLAWSDLFQKNDHSSFPIQYGALLPLLASLFFHFKLKTPAHISEQISRGKESAPAILNGFEQAEKELGKVYLIYTNYSIVNYSLNESIVVFGLLGMIIGGLEFQEFLGFFVTGLGLNLFMYPKPDAIYKQVKKRTQGFS